MPNLSLGDIEVNEDCLNMNGYLWTLPSPFDHTQYISVVITFGCIYMAIFILGVLLNVRVIASVLKQHSKYTRGNRRLAQDTLLINLMCADLLLAGTSVPFTPVNIIAKNWYFGRVMCHMVTFCQALSVMVTAGSLMSIALDRYIHIADHTIEALQGRWAVMIVIGIWSLSGAVNAPFFISMRIFHGSEWVPVFCGDYCIEDWSLIDKYISNGKIIYGTVIAAMQFLIPSIVITVCYVQILRIVQRNMIGGEQFFAGSSNARQRRLALERKKRVHYVLIAIVATFVLSWMPLTLKNLLNDFNLQLSVLRDNPQLVQLITHSIAVSSIIWNPLFIYVLTTKQRSKNGTNTTIATPTRLANQMAIRANGDRSSQTVDLLSKRRLSTAPKYSICGSNGNLIDESSQGSKKNSTTSAAKKLLPTRVELLKRKWISASDIRLAVANETKRAELIDVASAVEMNTLQDGNTPIRL